MDRDDTGEENVGDNPNTGARLPESESAPDYYQVWNQKLFDLVPTDCKRVLEVGCASGRLGEAVKKRNGGIHYVGIEVVEAAAKIARERLDEVYLENAEGFDWSRFDGQAFDCIIFGDVLEHLVDPKATFQNAARYLAREGSIVCCIPHVGHWSIISGLLEGKWEYSDSGLLDRTHLRFFTIASFREMLATCGFRSVQEDRYRTGVQLHPDIIPFLQRLNVEVQDFLDRVSTFQLLVRAQRTPISPSAQPVSWKPAGQTRKHKVAIIIPVYNKVDLTRDCLASIAKQYPSDFEPDVIVIDNASSDGTPDFLAQAQGEYEWLTCARSGTNLGFARACNKGAELADADVLVFLNNDTIVLPGWLEKMLDRIDDPGVGMVGSKLIYPDGSIQHAGMVFNAEAVPVHIHHRSGNGDPAVNSMMEYPSVTGACIMIKRSLFMELGGMDTQYPMYYEDVDLCFKVREKGRKVIYQPESMVIHLEGRSSPNLESIVAHNQTSRVLFFRKWKDFMLKDLASNPGLYATGKPYRPGLP